MNFKNICNNLSKNFNRNFVLYILITQIHYVTGINSQNDLHNLLEVHKPELVAKYHINKIGFFGSYSRNEQTNESDVDILVEFTKTPGLEFISLKDDLEQILDKHVDLVTKNALKPQMKEQILAETEYI